MNDMLLLSAGVIATSAAIIHGYLTQKYLVSPILSFTCSDSRMFSRLRAMLIQYSTFSWVIGGVALILATQLETEARRAIIVLVGAGYAFAVTGNAWATSGRHVGWMVYSVVLAMLIFAWR